MTPTSSAIPELQPRRAGRRRAARASRPSRRAHFRPTEVISSRLLPRAGRRRRERPVGDAARRSSCCTTSSASGSRPAGSPSSTPPTCSPTRRKQLVALAREHDVLPVAIVLDVPGARLPRPQRRRAPTATSAPHVIRRQRDQLRRGLQGPAARGVPHRARAARRRRGRRRRRSCGRSSTTTCATRPARSTSSATSTAAAPSSRRCSAELGYAIARDERRPRRRARIRDGRRAVFVGDLVDRGPGHPGRAAAGHGHGRRRRRVLRARQPREQAAARAARAQRAGHPRPGRVAGPARPPRPAEFRAEVEQLPRRPDQPLRARRRQAGRLARRADRALPGPRVGPGARVLPVRRDHRRDRRVRPAGPLPVGPGVPRPGDGALRPHPGADAGVDQQHAVPGHRLRVRRPAHRAALPGARARVGARRARCTTSRPGRSRAERRGAGRPRRRATRTSSTSPTSSASRVIETAATSSASASARRTPPPRWR